MIMEVRGLYNRSNLSQSLIKSENHKNKKGKRCNRVSNVGCGEGGRGLRKWQKQSLVFLFISISSINSFKTEIGF